MTSLRSNAGKFKSSVLVHLGYYNKIPETGWLVNTNLFLIVLEAGNLRSGYEYGWASIILWVKDFLLYPRSMEGEREFSRASFIKAVTPFMRTLPSWLNYLLKVVPPNTIKISTFEFRRRYKHSDLQQVGSRTHVFWLLLQRLHVLLCWLSPMLKIFENIFYSTLKTRCRSKGHNKCGNLVGI